MSFLRAVLVGALVLAGCAAAGSDQAKNSAQARVSARLHASERTSRQIEAQIAAVQRRLAASYPAGTVTVPGELVSQSAATDEQAKELQDLRVKLVKSRQEQRKLRAERRELNSVHSTAR